MTVAMPPRLSDEDIDYIVDRPPVWKDDPNCEGGLYMYSSIAQIRPSVSKVDIKMFDKYGYSNCSWQWFALGDEEEVRF